MSVVTNVGLSGQLNADVGMGNLKVAAKPTELSEPRTEGTMVVDVEWDQWSPEQVGMFMQSAGGFCSEHANKFVVAQCSGADLEKLDSEMLQGIGVDNGWHRYRIMDAVEVLKATAAEELSAIKSRDPKYHKLDTNKDGVVNPEDFAHSAKTFTENFLSFAFQKNVQQLVVGLMVGAGLKDVAQSLATDIITPLVIAPWTKNLDNQFIVLRDGKTNSTYNTIEAAADDGASTWNYGRFIDTLLSFLVMSFVVYVLFLILNWMRRTAQDKLARAQLQYKAWEKKNRAEHTKAGVHPKLELTCQ